MKNIKKPLAILLSALLVMSTLGINLIFASAVETGNGPTPLLSQDYENVGSKTFLTAASADYTATAAVQDDGTGNKVLEYVLAPNADKSYKFSGVELFGEETKNKLTPGETYTVTGRFRVTSVSFSKFQLVQGNGDNGSTSFNVWNDARAEAVNNINPEYDAVAATGTKNIIGTAENCGWLNFAITYQAVDFAYLGVKLYHGWVSGTAPANQTVQFDDINVYKGDVLSKVSDTTYNGVYMQNFNYYSITS